MTVTRGPNPLLVAWAVYRAQRVPEPRPSGSRTVDHTPLGAHLEILRTEGLTRLLDIQSGIREYRDYLETVEPDAALSYWLNLYNAGALDLAADATRSGEGSVLRVPGAFTRPWAAVGGEVLSLTEIEHGKIRRFGDPRVHGALVCGSASCPSLRFEPYVASSLSEQLDDQLRNFFASGGATIDRSSGRLLLSRILLWYGGDFTRPERMPTWLPASKPKLTAAVLPWLEPDTQTWVKADKPKVAFRPYNWELACAVA